MELKEAAEMWLVAVSQKERAETELTVYSNRLLALLKKWHHF